MFEFDLGWIQIQPRFTLFSNSSIVESKVKLEAGSNLDWTWIDQVKSKLNLI